MQRTSRSAGAAQVAGIHSMSHGRVRIKFCGITRLEDAERAVSLGVDALGFVFHPSSPRFVEPAIAAGIVRRLPAFVTAVGLFVDAPLEQVRETLRSSGIPLAQFHGDEPPDYCAAYGQAYVKAVRVRNESTITSAASDYAGAAALLLDTWHPQLAGGTGQVFDWRLVPAACSRPLVLAGGLASDNVAAAIALVRPYGVDVSGGIEQSKGIKDPARMRAFVAEVRRIEREH